MMPTTSNTVAVDRRLDLASLFCMIARHGPAVALAVVALVSVLAGFIIYRSVREKRRKATDDDDKHSAAERDLAAVPGLEPGPEESHSSAVSTGVGDEGLPGMKDDPDLDQGDLNIRHRRAAAATAAERKSPIYSPPKSDIQIPANRDITSNDTQEITTVQVPYKAAEAYAVEVIQNLQCDNHTLADMEMEGAADCHQGATDDTVQDMIQEIHSNDNCLKVAELINSESHQKDEKVFKAEYFGDDEMTIEEDVSDEKNRKKMENLQCASNSQVSFNQTSSMSENVDDDKLQDNKNTLETNFGESIIYAEDISVTCISYSKDGKSMKEDCHPESIDKFVKGNHHPESIDGSSYISNHFSAEEQEKNEGEEAKEECVDQQLLEQDETWSLTCEQEPKLPCSQQDQCDHISDKVVLPNNTSEWGDDGGQASVPQPDKPQQHIKVNENVITCNQENNNLLTVADQVTEKMLISGNSVSCDEECHNSSVVLSPTLHCVSEHAKVDNGDDDDLSGATTDGKAKLSGIGELDYQQTQSVVREEEITPPLEKDTDLTILGSDLPSLKTKVPDNENQSDVVAVLAEESIDLHVVSCYKDQQLGQMVNKDNIIVPAVPNSDAENNIASIMAEKISVLSCYKDQQSVQTKPNEAFEECGVASGPGTVPENVTSLVTGEEMSCPYLPSMCQNQESEHVEMSETFDETKITSATDRAVCGNISLMNPVMTEEISRPDMLSFCQDQQSDQMQNSKDFTDLVIGADSVLTKDQSPGVGAESGISSMTVSPDLHVAGDEFDMNIADAVLPTMDCDPQSEDRAVAQSSLLADDLDIPVINVDTAGMVSRSYTSCLSQQSEHADGVKYASLAANEDMFGNEIEERYQRAMEPFVAQIAADAVIKTDELQTDIKAVVEVVDIKEKKKGVSVAKKIETEAEKETEEDYEKTEISIMEATMDNNEWIMDSNYQVLPWMNPSVPRLTQDDTKTELPTEDHFPTDATCESDTPPTECKQSTTLPLSDENMENNKKVLAVQPMPQNVNVTFRIHYLTHSPYQTVAITGNHQELGNWKEFIPLESAKDGHWATVVSLPAESHVEWKFVVLDKGEVCRWEECGNRLLDTGYGDDLIVHKWWGFL